MKQISITIALALSCTIANAQNIKGSHQVRANDEVKKQQVENRSENRPLIYEDWTYPINTSIKYNLLRYVATVMLINAKDVCGLIEE